MHNKRKLTQQQWYFQQFILLFGSLLNLALLLCSLRSNHWINQKIPWKINGLDEDEFHSWRSSKTETSFVEVFSYSGLWKVCCNQSMHFYILA